MAEEEKQAPQTPEAEPAPRKAPAALPKEFFAQLLHLPACKAKGYCDDCGRCER